MRESTCEKSIEPSPNALHFISLSIDQLLCKINKLSSSVFIIFCDLANRTEDKGTIQRRGEELFYRVRRLTQQSNCTYVFVNVNKEFEFLKFARSFSDREENETDI